jgi:predicted ATPase with chaperone activity
LSQPTSKLVPVRQQNEVGNYEAPDFEIIEEPKQESASNQTSLKNIAGLEKAKQILMEAIISSQEIPLFVQSSQAMEQAATFMG